MKQLIDYTQIEILVREELSKVVTIDNFNCKPFDWYWNYTEQQKQEYYNKVSKELLSANYVKDNTNSKKKVVLWHSIYELLSSNKEIEYLENEIQKSYNLNDEDVSTDIVYTYINNKLGKILKPDIYKYFDSNCYEIVKLEYTYYLKDILQCITNPKFRLDILIELFSRNYEFDWRLIYLVQHINTTNKIHGIEDIINKAIEEDGDFEKVLNNSKVDNNELLNIIESVVSNMTKEVNEYKAGNKKAIGSILGKIKQQLPKGVDMKTVSEELNNYLK